MRWDRTMAVFALSMLLEWAALMLWQSGDRAVLAWALHGLVMVLMGLGLVWLKFTVEGIPGAPRWAFVMGCLIAALPVFGPALLIALTLIWRSPSPTAVSNHFIGQEDVYHGDEAVQSPRVDNEADILTIIRGAEPDLRRRAILGVRSYEPVAAVPVLQRCLQDSDELVRIYAQGILQTLVDNLEGRIRELRARLAKEDLSTPERIDLEVELAEALHEQVYTGLAEEEAVRKALLTLSCESIDRALALAPERLDLRFLRFRYLVELRDVVEANREMVQLVAAKYEPYQLLPWQCELAYLARDWKHLVPLVKATEKSGMAHGRMLNACALWREAAV